MPAVGRRLLEQIGRPREALAELSKIRPVLGQVHAGVRLGEGGADQGGHHGLCRWAPGSAGLRMKWGPQAAAGAVEDGAMAFFSPSWASEITSRTHAARGPPGPQEGRPGRSILGADHVPPRISPSPRR